MKKITAKLNLAEGSDENIVLSAIEKIQNDASDAIQALTTDKQNIASELQQSKDAVTALQNKLQQIEEREAEELRLKKEADQVDAEAKADELITNAVNIGKIKNIATVIASWKKLAVANLEETKSMIDSAEINKGAGKLDDNTGGQIKPDGTVAGRMLAITNRIQWKK